MSTLDAWLAERLPRIDAAFDARFGDTWPDAFGEALRYPLATRGKRVRPAVVLAAYEAVADDPHDLEAALPAALALELIHTYSLVHDDLPAMDDDDERRGQPTVHVRFGEAAAILVGDALLTEAFAVLAEAPLAAERRIAMVHQLAEAAGRRGMVGGQAADVGLAGPIDDLASLERLHGGKTGALLTASAVLGGLSAGADPDALDALRRYGRAVGLAFQLADDLLDADEDQGDQGPPSYVKLMGAEATRARAQQLADTALQAVSGLPRPERLVDLARFIIHRDH